MILLLLYTGFLGDSEALQRFLKGSESTIEHCIYGQVDQALTGVSQFSPYKESNNFTLETPMILEKTNKPTLFFLSLFVEYSKAFLCPMSIPVNHRSVDMQEILRMKDGKNLVQALFSTQASSVRDAPFYGLFYEIKPVVDVCFNETPPDSDDGNTRPTTLPSPSSPTDVVKIACRLNN